MANNEAGEIRRSSVIFTYGPGAVVDMRADGGYGGPISGCSTGLDEWDESAPPTSEELKGQTVTEARLSNRLKVRNFRLAPVVSEKNEFDRLVIRRFPEWLQCPRCAIIQKASNWSSEPGSASRFCASCSQAAPGQQKTFVAPVRFIIACEFGHLDEFPWHYWLRHKKECKFYDGKLLLESTGAGLQGLKLSCVECHLERSMDGVFSKLALAGFKCRALRPWLRSNDTSCDATGDNGDLRVLQRGATNVYYPIHVSALAIPPWTDRLESMIGDYWEDLVTSDDILGMIKIVKRLGDICESVGLTPEQLEEKIQIRIKQLSAQDNEDLKIDEYHVFTDKLSYNHAEFECHPVALPKELNLPISDVLRVPRLREVRALTSFTRIEAFSGDNSKAAKLSVEDKNWLPGAEIRGEGIFLAFDQVKLSEWEESKEVLEHVKELNSKWQLVHPLPDPDVDRINPVSPRNLMIHSFSHALMSELTLECGYSSASLKERLYVSEGKNGMAGVLIYTGTTDSEGTLGGLEMRGKVDLIVPSIENAIRKLSWCSADPVCSEGLAAAPESFSIASCHSCLLLPETACELHNKFLDRSLLVGTLDRPRLGFFTSAVSSNG